MSATTTTTADRRGIRYPLEVRIKVWQMVLADRRRCDIMALLGIGKNAMQRIIKDGDPLKSLKQPPVRNPTKCNGTIDCNCVYHAAEAWKRNNHKPA
jgi:hypothetical protein